MSKKGQLLRLTAAQAVQYGIADKLVISQEDLLADMEAGQARLIKDNPSGGVTTYSVVSAEAFKVHIGASIDMSDFQGVLVDPAVKDVTVTTPRNGDILSDTWWDNVVIRPHKGNAVAPWLEDPNQAMMLRDALEPEPVKQEEATQNKWSIITALTTVAAITPNGRM